MRNGCCQFPVAVKHLARARNNQSFGDVSESSELVWHGPSISAMRCLNFGEAGGNAKRALCAHKRYYTTAVVR